MNYLQGGEIYNTLNCPNLARFKTAGSAGLPGCSGRRKHVGLVSDIVPALSRKVWMQN